MSRLLKKIIGLFNNKTFQSTIILFFLGLIFRDNLWKAYDKYIVDGLLYTIKTHWFNDIIFIAILIFSAVFVFHSIKRNKKVANSLFFLVVVFFSLLVYSRFFSDRYYFENFTFLTSLKYFDIIAIQFGCLLFVQIFNRTKAIQEPIYDDNPFIADKPILTESEDILGRSFFARQIATRIQSRINLVGYGALAIGVNGQWGSGKTSFLNIIKNLVDKKNRIIIDFNPWRSSSPQKIIEDFFELLIDELKEYDPKLSSAIDKYSKSLMNIDQNLFTNSAKVVSEHLFSNVNKSVTYNYINTTITKTKKQIIIFIDDLDRLDKLEIIEVLRLIRNTANFNNVVYLASYDKNYVGFAIKEFNEHNSFVFLEKIFQFEFTLPLYEHGILRSAIKDHLKRRLNTKFYTQIDRVVDSREFYGVNFTNEIIKTYRDVVRFVNSLLFEIESVQEEVYFFDFYLLQLLKLKFSAVYESIFDNQHLFFSTDPKSGAYILKFVEDHWINDDILLDKKMWNGNAATPDSSRERREEVIFEKYLDEKAGQFGLSIYSKELVLHLIRTLLELKQTNTDSEDSDLYKSFSYPINFHKYFAFRLYETDISAREFEDYRRRDFEQYKSKVIDWLTAGKYSLLVDKLAKVRYFGSVLEFENHVLILFEIGRYLLYKEKKDSEYIDYGLVLSSLRYPVLVENTIRLYKDVNEYATFLTQTFEQAPDPYVYESCVIVRATYNASNTPLNNSTLLGFNLRYFIKYCESHSAVTPEFRILHRNIVNNSTNVNDWNVTRDMAQEIFVKYFKENLSACQLTGFIVQTSPQVPYYLINTKWLFVFFTTWNDFEKYLEASSKVKEKNECYYEFLSFYKAFKSEGYLAIPFEFKFLAPNGSLPYFHPADQ